MSAFSDLITRMRVRLNETTARQWDDTTQLLPYLSEAQQWLARTLSHVPGTKRFRYEEDITVAANTATYDLTGLTKQFDFVVYAAVQVANLWVPIYDFDDRQEAPLTNLSLGGGYIIPSISLQDDTLIVRPTFGSARTIRLRYGWVPPVVTSAATTVLTPAMYDGDLILRAQHFAMADAGLTNTSFDEEFAARVDEIVTFERARLGPANGRVIQRSSAFSRCR